VPESQTSLARTLIELAGIGAGSLVEEGYARVVVARFTELLEPAEVGLMLVDDRGRPKASAVSTPRIDGRLWTEECRDNGPCAWCLQAGRPTLNQSLIGSSRYQERARQIGFQHVSAFPLRHGSRTLGTAVVLHRHRLDAARSDMAELLAEAAAIAIVQQRQLRHTEVKVRQLQQALDSRVVIEQAKGAVAARFGVTPSEAFELIRGYARENNLKLADVCAAAVSGGLPLRLPRAVIFPPS
jgi:ANTAR domain-containing protein/GAF domain-containing protein